MVLAGIIIGVVAAFWLGVAGFVVWRLGLGFRQALLYAPLKLIFRIKDRDIRTARGAKPPVIYAITHQSRLDPALMLSLLPADTLHILNDEAARSPWLEPWRELARTIAFNASHVFVSRRLVRHLKGKGRLAVYFPASTEPDVKDFRLYRAVARIAARADASIVAIHVAGSGDGLGSRAPAHIRLRNPFPRFSITALDPLAIADAVAQGSPKRMTNSLALFDRTMEARYATGMRERSLFAAVVAAAKRHGPRRTVFGSGANSISYRTLLMQVRMLAAKIASSDGPEKRPVGLMLSEPAAFVTSLLAVHSAGRTAAPLDAAATLVETLAQARLAGIAEIICSRLVIEQAKLSEVTQLLEDEGLRILWLEDLMQDIGLLQAFKAQLYWRRPLMRVRADQPAIVLSSVQDKDERRAPVVLHRNLLADIGHIDARIDLMASDRLFCAFSPASRCGMTACLFPLLSGVRQSGLEEASVVTAPSGWFAAHAPSAGEMAYGNLRAGLTCGETVPADIRDAWRQGCGMEILEAYISDRAGCTVALGSSVHSRPGTLGRFLPAMMVRTEPVVGIENGGRLWVRGESVAAAFISAGRPGEIQPSISDWLDTGDIVTVDREGFVELRGPASRHASVGKSLVRLDSVEALAHSLWPRAKHAALAFDDSKEGERIVLATTSRNAQRDPMRQAARKAGLDAAHVPVEIVRLERMPQTDDGQPDLPALRRIVLESIPSTNAA